MRQHLAMRFMWKKIMWLRNIMQHAGGWMAVGSYVLLCSMFFLAFPVGYAPDSDSFIINAKVFAEMTLPEFYIAVRSPMLPLVLAAMFRVFGVTDHAVKVALFLFWLVYVLSLWNILQWLDGRSKRLKFIRAVFFVAVFLANPMIVSYSHLCLAEFPSMAVSVMFFALYLKIVCEEKKFAIRLVLMAVFSVVLYAVKQAAFPLGILIPLAIEFFLPLQNGWLQRVRRGFLYIMVGLLSVGASAAVWNVFSPSGSAEDGNIVRYAGSFVADGLRYFYAGDAPELNEPVRVAIVDDSFVEKDSFTAVIGTDAMTNLRYFFKCLQQAPDRILAGYRDTYTVVCGVSQVVTKDSYLAHRPIERRAFWGKGGENELWIRMAAQYPESFRPMQLSQMEISVANPAFLWLLRLVWAPGFTQISLWLFAVINLFSPLFLLLFSLLKKLTWLCDNSLNCCVFLAACMVTGCFAVFLTLTAQCNERYMFPCCFFNQLIIFLFPLQMQGFFTVIGRQLISRFFRNYGRGN